MHSTETAGIPPAQHFWTAESGDALRITVVSLLRALRRPIVLGMYAIIVVVTVIFVLAGDHTMATFFATVAIGLPLALFGAVYRVNRKTLYPGAQWSSGVNDFGILLKDPLAEVVIGRHSISKIEVHSGVVFLYLRGTRRAASVPESLCPPEARDLLLSSNDSQPRST